MKEIISRSRKKQRLRPECILCAVNAQICKYPEDISMSEKTEYMQKVLALFANAPREAAVPVIVRDIEKLRFEMFGQKNEYREIKEHFNAMLCEEADAFRDMIARAADPLKLAMQLALVGNYIDFAVLDHVDEDILHQMLREAEEKLFDEKTYLRLRGDLGSGARLVYFTDNCGEIVFDRLLIEEIKRQYPRISVTVIVRGQETLNDATMEDAIQVGMDKVAHVAGNGNDIAGTWFPELSEEAADLIKKADVLISKGQANFETMRCCGLNIYYLFLCKCDMFARQFQVPRFTGMLINDSDTRNV